MKKAYTDIEQSRKLAEILPIESADMHYATWTILDNEFIVSPNQGSTIKSLQEDYGNQIIPCWSLAALIDYLAKKDCFPEITYTGTCYLMDVNFYDDEEGKLLHPIHFIRTEGKSLVDAGVEMILKLHKEKLI